MTASSALASPERTVIPTGVTLDYEAEKWGATRLMLDGISNHLDAVGTLERVSVSVARDRIVIADDGPGYDAALLGLLYSTRKDDPNTIGEFGEGVKLAASAALRAGLNFTVRSRSWEARAVSLPVSFEAAPGQTRTVQQLAWEVSPAEPIAGSRTILSRTPLLPPDVSLAFLHWPRRFLPDEQRLVTTAWEVPQPALFVKGVWVRDLSDHRFTYNLPDAAISRDRDTIDIAAEVKRFWEHVTDPATATMLLRAAWAAASGVVPPFAEMAMYFWPKRPEVWAEAFTAAFGESAVLATGPQPSYHATAAGYTPIQLPSTLAYCIDSAVRKDKDVVVKAIQYGFRALTAGEAAVIDRAQALVARADGAGPFPVIAMTTPPTELLGVADPETQTIGIAERALSRLEDALPVYIEEHAHLASGKGDFQRGFEEWLVRFADRALRVAGGSTNG